jgi:hypothetical protein
MPQLEAAEPRCYGADDDGEMPAFCADCRRRTDAGEGLNVIFFAGAPALVHEDPVTCDWRIEPESP